MSKRGKTLLGYLDWWIIIIYLTLVFFGYISLYSTAQEKTEKQLIWILSSFLLVFFLLLIKPMTYKNMAYLSYIITLLLLLGLLFFGKNINGARSWYKIGDFSFQPVELAKISVTLTISKILSIRDVYIKDNILLSFIIAVILSLPITLLILQPDTGSVLIFSSFILVFYREGMPLYILLYILLLIIIFLLIFNQYFWIISISLSSIFLTYIFLILKKYTIDSMNLIMNFIIICGSMWVSPIIFNRVLKQYHRDRIEILFKDESDKKYKNNIGYNIFYSKNAIRLGGLFGKGFGKGIITKGKFVPEQHTDYIFSAFSEEFGFIGSASLLIIYLILIGRIYFLADNQKGTFSRVLGYSTGSILFMHLIINLGMVMGIMPTVGVPFIFFSYGGTSFLCSTALLFIFIRLDASNRQSLI